jgi:3-methyladenine DNA glycosylase AlkC
LAEPLKNQFGTDIPARIAGMILQAFPAFDRAAFVRDAMDGYEALELMPRGWKIAHALRRHLPADYEAAVAVLLDAVGPKPEGAEGSGMAPFFYLPHVCFVAGYGLDHFEASMHAQYVLTQRFTAEFSIRPFLERHPEATLARLATWATDPSVHVRRLVSEGTRPRLPWAPRLRAFQKDPRPVLALLELLKDDPELYVRRSVANNLNDIGKDHPAVLAETARRWLSGATAERRWLVRHALRSAVKRAEPGALAVLGFGERARVRVDQIRIAPGRAAQGGSVTVAFELTNTDTRPQRVLVDFRIHFVKASGQARPKVFKLKTVDLAPQETVTLSKTVSLADLTTRKHYPGTHAVDVIINGVAEPLGRFELVAE